MDRNVYMLLPKKPHKHTILTRVGLQGDFSWTVPDPRAYMLLPKKLIDCGDWHAFRSLMCDLRFLWRKMQENGVLSLLHTYAMADVPLAAKGTPSSHLCLFV